jgi:hypothetical protein
MSIPANGKGTRKCRWCGRRRVLASFRDVPTALGVRPLCFECRNAFLPIFGGGKPYGKEGVADAGGEGKAKAGASEAKHVPLLGPQKFDEIDGRRSEPSRIT